jgi:hypothetical protein
MGDNRELALRMESIHHILNRRADVLDLGYHLIDRETFRFEIEGKCVEGDVEVHSLLSSIILSCVCQNSCV